MDQNAYLQALDIKKVFSVEDIQIDVLKGISIKIGKGDFGIIFGPSGCGKSTLLHTLLGLEVPTSGKIYLDVATLPSSGKKIFL
jgi:putative ABC transport system ATP-binding protein